MKGIRRRRDDGTSAVEAGFEEDTLKPACIEWKRARITLMALLVISPIAAVAQNSANGAKTTPGASAAASSQLPKIWHSLSSQKDFRVEIKDDVFRAEWVNLPAAAVKMGAYIRTECRRTGTKWVGSSSVYQGVAISGAPPGKDVKMCHLTVRFEVDSITPEKIIFHSEAMRNLDAAKCQLLQTAWEEFAWVPKK